MLKLNCLNDPIKEKLSDIVTQFHKDIEHIQDVRKIYAYDEYCFYNFYSANYMYWYMYSV